MDGNPVRQNCRFQDGFRQRVESLGGNGEGVGGNSKEGERQVGPIGEKFGRRDGQITGHVGRTKQRTARQGE